MEDLLLVPLADAFMQVGVFVFLLVGLAGLVRGPVSRRLVAPLGRRRSGPVLGALLGVAPGCAGALMLVPLFRRGRVGYGTLVAALTATMGDSSWVLAAGAPGTALVVHAALFVAGVGTGWAVDRLGLGRRAAAQPAPTASPPPADLARRAQRAEPEVPPARRAVAGTLARSEAFLSAGTWVGALLGAFVGVPVVFHLTDGPALATAFGGVDPYLVVGVVGTLFAAALVVHGWVRDRRHGPAPPAAVPPPPRARLVAGAREGASTVLLVAVLFVGWAVLEHLGLDLAVLPLAGVSGVLIAVAVGLIPGCAAQIAFTTLYLTGTVPLAGLMANAISQKGDALIPLLGFDRRAALSTSLLTTVPALAVGGVVLLVAG